MTYVYGVREPISRRKGNLPVWRVVATGLTEADAEKIRERSTAKGQTEGEDFALLDEE